MGVASTGSGKTFAAFLSCIDQLFTHALAREINDDTHVPYVSPLLFRLTQGCVTI